MFLSFATGKCEDYAAAGYANHWTGPLGDVDIENDEELLERITSQPRAFGIIDF